MQKDRKIHRPCQRTIKAVEHEVDGDINYNWYTWNGPQCFGECTEGIGNQWKNLDHRDYAAYVHMCRQKLRIRVYLYAHTHTQTKTFAQENSLTQT